MKKIMFAIFLSMILVFTSYAGAINIQQKKNSNILNSPESNIVIKWIPKDEWPENWENDKFDENGPVDGQGLDDVNDWRYYQMIYHHATTMRIVLIICSCTLLIPIVIQQFLQWHLFMYFAYCEAFDLVDLDGDEDQEPFYYLDDGYSIRDAVEGFAKGATSEKIFINSF